MMHADASLPFDDSALFRLLTRSDEDAFTTLMHRYAKTLCAFAVRLTGDEAAAEDIVQDVFVHLWEKRRTFDASLSLRNLLYLSVRNGALNYLRMQQVRQAYAESLPTEPEVEAYVVEEELYRLLDEAIGQLPPRTAEVIRHSRDGIPQEEIAQRMGITVATVKMLKAHGIQKLRQLLGSLALLLLPL